MNSITQAREGLAALLKTVGNDVLPYVPAHINAPQMVMSTDNPQLTKKKVFSKEYDYHLRLWLLADVNDNETGTTAMDQWVEETVSLLHNSDFDVTGIEALSLEDYAGSIYLAVQITIDTTIEIGGTN